MGALFGPAGNSEAFYAAGHKSTLQMPGFLEQMGLTAYEYQCGRGVTIKEDTARALGAKATEHGIALSVHAPYYISLASTDEKKRLNSVRYILESARAAHWMGGTRVVVHPGGLNGRTRAEAAALALETLRTALAAMEAEGLGHITLCPETMGKINQLGDFDEVMAFCRADERLLPCIDFGHLNARALGNSRTRGHLLPLFDTMENALGRERARSFHAHFSKIEYSSGGEKRHLTFEDTDFGPDFEPVLDIVLERSLSPTFICESAGTQTQDASAMQLYYSSAGRNDKANA